MKAEQKEKRLREFAESVLKYPESREEIRQVLSVLNLSEEEVIEAYINYDMDVFSYENEIYEPLKMRAVLYMHYLLKGSWHQDRQNSILKLVKKISPDSIVDMGFGAPTKYIKKYIFKNKTKLVLVDLYESAFKFSESLFELWEPSWREFISFRKLNMNTHEYPGDFECYIFQDSIEHVKEAGRYLTKVVDLSPKNAKFILSLPIGPLVPAHTISWNTKEEAVEWLNKCGLKVLELDKVYINPKVDLFAEKLNREFYNLIVLCSKL